MMGNRPLPHDMTGHFGASCEHAAVKLVDGAATSETLGVEDNARFLGYFDVDDAVQVCEWVGGRVQQQNRPGCPNAGSAPYAHHSCWGVPSVHGDVWGGVGNNGPPCAPCVLGCPFCTRRCLGWCGEPWAAVD